MLSPARRGETVQCTCLQQLVSVPGPETLADNSEKSFIKSLTLDVGCSSGLELLPGIYEEHNPKHIYQEYILYTAVGGSGHFILLCVIFFKRLTCF